MEHPGRLIDIETVNQIRSYAFEAERSGSLPGKILDIIYHKNWFRLLTPSLYEGLELPLPEAVKLFEALAWADANVGWCVNLGAGANMFAGYFRQDVAASIFNTSTTCCAGSGACSGQAVITGGGYRLSGKWKYASGSNHATHFTANAFLVTEEGSRIYDRQGQPVFKSFIVPAGQIINHNNWSAIGLKATSSNDFEIREQFVPEEHTFSLLNASTFNSHPLYRFPFQQMAIVNMTSMIMGMAIHFIDLYEEMARVKIPIHSDQLLINNPIASSIAGKVIKNFDEKRSYFYACLESIWEKYVSKQTADSEMLKALDLAASGAATVSRQVFSEIYPLFGMSIVSPESMANKVWRDACTASQHYLLSPVYNG